MPQKGSKIVIWSATTVFFCLFYKLFQYFRNLYLFASIKKKSEYRFSFVDTRWRLLRRRQTWFWTMTWYLHNSRVGAVPLQLRDEFKNSKKNRACGAFSLAIMIQPLDWKIASFFLLFSLFFHSFFSIILAFFPPYAPCRRTGFATQWWTMLLGRSHVLRAARSDGSLARCVM